jgi:hypothetical protein
VPTRTCGARDERSSLLLLPLLSVPRGCKTCEGAGVISQWSRNQGPKGGALPKGKRGHAKEERGEESGGLGEKGGGCRKPGAPGHSKPRAHVPYLSGGR